MGGGHRRRSPTPARMETVAMVTDPHRFSRLKLIQAG